MELQKHLGAARTRQLLVDWFRRLGQEGGLPFDQYSRSSDTYTIGNKKEFHVLAHFEDDELPLRFVASDSAMQLQVDQIAEQARTKVSAAEFGGEIWYTATFFEEDLDASSPSLMTEILMRIGSQVRIRGWRRLGSNILLEFKEGSIDEVKPEGPLFLVPKVTVDAHIAVRAPCPGEFAGEVIGSHVETIGAICNFALGRPLKFLSATFPTEEKSIPDLAAKKNDPKIGGLARKSISLDIFGELIARGGIESHSRAKAAVLTYDAALKQDRDPVAIILFVVVCEALSVPFAKWQKNKPTKRFIEFLDELMPADLDAIVQHTSFEEAFGIRIGDRSARSLRRELLDRIYELRSGIVHKGLAPSYAIMFGEVSGGVARRGLLADIAEMAILRFIESPRSSIVGHPSF